MKKIMLLTILAITLMSCQAKEITSEDRCVQGARLDYNVEDVYCYNPKYDPNFCECFRLACGQISCREMENTTFSFFMRFLGDNT